MQVFLFILVPPFPLSAAALLLLIDGVSLIIEYMLSLTVIGIQLDPSIFGAVSLRVAHSNICLPPEIVAHV
jgi:hypothetical protein